ncbi:hypothetical protein Bca4012_054276 [Brassica carinata]
MSLLPYKMNQMLHVVTPHTQLNYGSSHIIQRNHGISFLLSVAKSAISKQNSTCNKRENRVREKKQEDQARRRRVSQLRIAISSLLSSDLSLSIFAPLWFSRKDPCLSLLLCRCSGERVL